MRTYVSRRRLAFTLIELLVALTIIVALTILAMPAIGPMMSTSSVDSGASIVRAGLMRARNSAVAQQGEGFCWLAEGSVVESGVISSTAGGSELTITIDNTDTSGDDPDNYFSYTGTAGSNTSTTATGYFGANYRWIAGTSGGVTGTARWNFKVPDSGMTGDEVQLTVSAHWPYMATAGLTAARLTVNYEGGSSSHDVNQQTEGGSFLPLGTHPFLYGSTYSVVLTNSSTTYGQPNASTNKYLFADAVRITGGTGAAASDNFTDESQAWTANMWVDKYYVVIGAKNAETGDITTTFERIKESNSNTITTYADLKDSEGNDVPLTAGSRYLIHQGDPSAPGGQQTIGSGTDAIASWDKLPDGAAVSIYHADTDGNGADDDRCSTCGKPAIGYLNNDQCPHEDCGAAIAPIDRWRVFPVVFTNKGRATYATPTGLSDPGHITFKIYSRERPHDANLWRYVRLYRNTGRAAIAHKLSDLN